MSVARRNGSTRGSQYNNLQSKIRESQLQNQRKKTEKENWGEFGTPAYIKEKEFKDFLDVNEVQMNPGTGYMFVRLDKDSLMEEQEEAAGPPIMQSSTDISPEKKLNREDKQSTMSKSIRQSPNGYYRGGETVKGAVFFELFHESAENEIFMRLQGIKTLPQPNKEATSPKKTEGKILNMLNVIRDVNWDGINENKNHASQENSGLRPTNPTNLHKDTSNDSIETFQGYRDGLPIIEIQQQINEDQNLKQIRNHNMTVAEKRKQFKAQGTLDDVRLAESSLYPISYQQQQKLQREMQRKQTMGSRQLHRFQSNSQYMKTKTYKKCEVEKIDELMSENSENENGNDGGQTKQSKHANKDNLKTVPSQQNGRKSIEAIKEVPADSVEANNATALSANRQSNSYFDGDSQSQQHIAPQLPRPALVSSIESPLRQTSLAQHEFNVLDLTQETQPPPAYISPIKPMSADDYSQQDARSTLKDRPQLSPNQPGLLFHPSSSLYHASSLSQSQVSIMTLDKFNNPVQKRGNLENNQPKIDMFAFRGPLIPKKVSENIAFRNNLSPMRSQTVHKTGKVRLQKDDEADELKEGGDGEEKKESPVRSKSIFCHLDQPLDAIAEDADSDKQKGASSYMSISPQRRVSGNQSASPSRFRGSRKGSGHRRSGSRPLSIIKTETPQGRSSGDPIHPPTYNQDAGFMYAGDSEDGSGQESEAVNGGEASESRQGRSGQCIFYTKTFSLFKFRSSVRRNKSNKMVKKKGNVCKGQYVIPFTLTLPRSHEYPSTFQYLDKDKNSYKIEYVLQVSFNEHFDEDSFLHCKREICILQDSPSTPVPNPHSLHRPLPSLKLLDPLNLPYQPLKPSNNLEQGQAQEQTNLTLKSPESGTLQQQSVNNNNRLTSLNSPTVQNEFFPMLVNDAKDEHVPAGKLQNLTIEDEATLTLNADYSAANSQAHRIDSRATTLKTHNASDQHQVYPLQAGINMQLALNRLSVDKHQSFARSIQKGEIKQSKSSLSIDKELKLKQKLSRKFIELIKVHSQIEEDKNKNGNYNETILRRLSTLLQSLKTKKSFMSQQNTKTLDADSSKGDLSSELSVEMGQMTQDVNDEVVQVKHAQVKEEDRSLKEKRVSVLKLDNFQSSNQTIQYKKNLGGPTMSGRGSLVVGRDPTFYKRGPQINQTQLDKISEAERERSEYSRGVESFNNQQIFDRASMTDNSVTVETENFHFNSCDLNVRKSSKQKRKFIRGQSTKEVISRNSQENFQIIKKMKTAQMNELMQYQLEHCKPNDCQVNTFKDKSPRKFDTQITKPSEGDKNLHNNLQTITSDHFSEKEVSIRSAQDEMVPGAQSIVEYPNLKSVGFKDSILSTQQFKNDLMKRQNNINTESHENFFAVKETEKPPQLNKSQKDSKRLERMMLVSIEKSQQQAEMERQTGCCGPCLFPQRAKKTSRKNRTQIEQSVQIAITKQKFNNDEKINTLINFEPRYNKDFQHVKLRLDINFTITDGNQSGREEQAMQSQRIFEEEFDLSKVIKRQRQYTNQQAIMLLIDLRAIQQSIGCNNDPSLWQNQLFISNLISMNTPTFKVHYTLHIDLLDIKKGSYLIDNEENNYDENQQQRRQEGKVDTEQRSFQFPIELANKMQKGDVKSYGVLIQQYLKKMSSKSMGPCKELQEFFAQGYPGPRAINIKPVSKQSSQISGSQNGNGPQTPCEAEEDKKSVLHPQLESSIFGLPDNFNPLNLPAAHFVC